MRERVYQEYFNDKLIKNIKFTDLEYSILFECENKVLSIFELSKILNSKIDALQNAVLKLNNNYILYTNKDFTKIISIINLN